MPTKYDTNPLDPDFPAKAKAAAEAEVATRTLRQTGPETRQFAEPGEEQTRRFAPANTSDYTPPYTGQYVPANVAGFGSGTQSISRKVDKVGLPENIMTAVPYIPWYPGMVAALIMLFVLPKSEAKVRFHAAQGLAAHAAIWIVAAILGGFSGVTGFANAASGIFTVVTSIMMIVFAYRAWKGRPVHIESVDSLTNWLEEKISPKS
ncbi:MAG: hypothetical protein ACKVRN_09085 [Pyrinomonadaceae bacterium]